MAVLLLASVAAQSGLVAAAVDESSIDFEDGGSGNFIINYIYEIEIENKDNPRLELDDDTVPQGGSFVANGTNFDANSTADMSIFHEQLLSLSEDGEAAERSAAVLLTKSNLTISEDGEDLVIENADNETSTAGGDGSVMLVTNVFPTDASSGEYDISLECEAGPDGNSTSAGFDDPLTVDNSTSKQFFELTMPAGEYEQCQVVMTPSDEDDPAIESSAADLTVVAGSESETSVASVNGTTDKDGSFMQNVTVASDAEEGRYVLMAETTNDTDDTTKRAITPLTIIDEDETSTAGTDGDSAGDNSNGGTNGTGNTTNNPPGSTDGGNGTNTPPDGDTDPQGPPAPPDDGGGNTGGGGEYEDPCQDVVSDSGNVNNTITQSSSQSASNTVSDDDVINVVQRIHGTYNGTGHLNTNIAIDDSDTVSQSVNQDVAQNAVIKKCPGEPAEGGNQTNTIDMNATQLASNAYSDNTTIIIVQTIIIPKDCNTNVNAPISISDRDTVTQSVDQGIDQDGTIAYGGSGEGSNTVVQTSMQVAHNNATNDEVITINQVIIVPPDCPVEIQAPVVIEGDDNVQMSATQTAEQDAAINSGAGGVTIVSTVGDGSDQTTNTIVTVASQDGQNSFSDDDTIIITQNIYYVNDTAGWTEENYEENLEEEFGNSTSGNSTDTEGNSTSSIPSNSTETELGGDNSTLPVIYNSGTGDNSSSTEDPDAMMMAAMTVEEENVVFDSGSTGDAGSSTSDETPSDPEPVVEDAGSDADDASPPPPDNSADMSSEQGAADPPVEQTVQEENSEQPPETDTVEQETPSEPVENTDTTTTDETGDEQPPVEETSSDPPVVEETPPDTNTTDTTPPEDPAPVETADTPGNSTST